MAKKNRLSEVEIHTARLFKLALILTLHQDGNTKRGTVFNMGTWGHHDGKHKPTMKENFCGTAACAMGHAAMDKEFRADGLKLEWLKLDDGEGWAAEVKFRGEQGSDAGAAFFGLTPEEARVFLNTGADKEEVIRELGRLAIERQEVL